MALQERSNRCLGTVLWQFLFECYPRSTRTFGGSSHLTFELKIQKASRYSYCRAEPQDRCDVSGGYYQKLQTEGSHMATVPSVLGHSRTSNLCKHFLILGPEPDKIWWLKKVQQYLQKRYHCRWTLLRGKTPKWIFHNLGNLLQPLEFVPDSRKHVVPTEWQVRTVLGDCISKARIISIQAPQYRQYALISDFLDLAKLSIRY